MNPRPDRSAPCGECGRGLSRVGPGVACPTCGSVNYVFPTGEALLHLTSSLAPLDPAQRLVEHLGEMGLGCEVETDRALYIPVYLFVPEHGDPIWEPAWDDLAARFLRRITLAPSKLTSFKEPADGYELVRPGVGPRRAGSRLKQRGLAARGYRRSALVHLPAHRLRYRLADRRQVALALVDSIYTENPPRPLEESLRRQRLFFGAATAGAILLTTLLIGGWVGALLSLAEGLGGTVLLARQSRRP